MDVLASNAAAACAAATLDLLAMTSTERVDKACHRRHMQKHIKFSTVYIKILNN